MLAPEEIEKIKSASLEILEHTGVNIAHAHAREVLQAVGAKVEGERVYFPPKIRLDKLWDLKRLSIEGSLFAVGSLKRIK